MRIGFCFVLEIHSTDVDKNFVKFRNLRDSELNYTVYTFCKHTSKTNPPTSAGVGPSAMLSLQYKSAVANMPAGTKL